MMFCGSFSLRVLTGPFCVVPVLSRSEQTLTHPLPCQSSHPMEPQAGIKYSRWMVHRRALPFFPIDLTILAVSHFWVPKW